jgi:hypothetical protein
VSPPRKPRARARPPPSPLETPTPSEAQRRQEAWTLAKGLQESLGPESLDEATLRLAHHLFQTALILDESLTRPATAPLRTRHDLRMRLLDVLLAWDDVGLPNTSLWNLFDALGAARGTRPLPAPSPEPDPFRAFHKAFTRLRRHAGRPTMPAALVYTWAALARCLGSCLTELALTLGRPESPRPLPGTRGPKPPRTRAPARPRSRQGASPPAGPGAERTPVPPGSRRAR